MILILFQSFFYIKAAVFPGFQISDCFLDGLHLLPMKADKNENNRRED